MGNLIPAIVRGPGNYFDGELHAPGQIVEVDEDFVSTEDFIEKEVEVHLNPPILDKDNRLVRFVKETIKVRTQFRPVGTIAQAEEGTTTAEIATGDLARLNVTDFLKGGTDDIVKSIVNGNVDEFLGAIEQAELSRKGPARAAVKDAIAARLAAKAG